MMTALMICSALATAPGEASLTKELQAAMEKGRWSDAAELAYRLERLAAARAPLRIVDLQVLATPPDGLGLYSAPYGGKIGGAEVYLYAQVRNHTLRQVAGRHQLHLVSDLVVLDAQGKELARDEALGESRFAARTAHRDTFVVIALRTRGLPVGRYQLKLILHDVLGGKEASGQALLEITQ